MAGRPREFDRDEALLRARDLFWRRGYEGVSMTDLVDALGLASARIYAAFGSKAALFREAVEHYEHNEGGFADRALAEEPTVYAAIKRTLLDAIDLYTRGAQPNGCMVVAAATNCTQENAALAEWLAEHRRQRADAFRLRIERGKVDGDVPPETDGQVVGDYFAALLHGISVQARDGVSRARLRRFIAPALSMIGEARSRP